MRTPGASLKEHQSPKNDLTDVAGLKQLVATPRLRRAQVVAWLLLSNSDAFPTSLADSCPSRRTT